MRFVGPDRVFQEKRSIVLGTWRVEVILLLCRLIHSQVREVIRFIHYISSSAIKQLLNTEKLLRQIRIGVQLVVT